MNLTGRRFGRLVAFDYERRGAGAHTVIWWRLRCDCGNETLVRAHSLRAGHTTSCGCIAKESARALLTVHGNCHRPEWHCWIGMRRRCNDPRASSYPRYGGRGIRVCERWASFDEFVKDVGPRPSPEHTLDRIDPDGDYTRGNVVWADRKAQARHKRNSFIVEIDGCKRPLIEVCETLGKNYNRVRVRIRKYGWSVERALGT